MHKGEHKGEIRRGIWHKRKTSLEKILENMRRLEKKSKDLSCAHGWPKNHVDVKLL
jgi:hypothetical protein